MSQPLAVSWSQLQNEVGNMDKRSPDITERLTETEFDQVFGRRLSQAIGFNDDGKCVVNSALTRKSYIHWDWSDSRYVVEPRRQS